MPIASPRRRSHSLKIGLATALLLLQSCAAPTPEVRPAGDVAPPPPPPTAEAPALNGRLVVDAQEYPWSAIGRLNLAGQGFCNGILIGAQQVLTQARCLYSAREDRLWQPREIHFIAAYQKDRFLADSKITGFTLAPGYNPASRGSLANLTNNWAVVTLAKPIGLQTGWLGLQWKSAEIPRGDVAYLRAGYRSDWPHAISLHFGCNEARGDLTKLCAPTPTELALPPFVFVSGELRVLADFYLRSAAEGVALARLAATTLADNRLGRSEAPSTTGPVRRAPSVSASLFLSGLGYDVAGEGLEAAITRYLRDEGLPARSGADIALLTALVKAAQRKASQP